MKIAKKIVHQQQPSQKSCVSACLGMLLGIPAMEVEAEFHDDYIAGKCISEYFIEKGIRAEPMLSTYRDLEPGSLYLIMAPSLNLEAHTHEIIFDYRDHDNFQIFDPNMGRPGKKYYVWKNAEDLEELEVNIHSYFFDFEIK